VSVAGIIGVRSDPSGKRVEGRTGGAACLRKRTRPFPTGVRKRSAKGDFDAIDDIYAPEVAQELKQAVAELWQAFPDFHGTNEIQIAEGDMVANRFVFHGIHRGEFMGISPTGREVTFEGLSIDRVVDDKIMESWVEWDLEDIVRQIGAVLRAEVSEQSEEASPT
jgi:predicted ester cyclase